MLFRNKPTSSYNAPFVWEEILPVSKMWLLLLFLETRSNWRIIAFFPIEKWKQKEESNFCKPYRPPGYEPSELPLLYSAVAIMGVEPTISGYCTGVVDFLLLLNY